MSEDIISKNDGKQKDGDLENLRIRLLIETMKEGNADVEEIQNIVQQINKLDPIEIDEKRVAERKEIFMKKVREKHRMETCEELEKRNTTASAKKRSFGLNKAAALFVMFVSVMGLSYLRCRSARRLHK